mgnify:FL=1
MEPIASFSLARHEGPYEQWPPKTPLLFEGQPTGREIPGYVLEAQYRCSAGYLLITSQDCPFEESNDFLLLARDLHVLARTRLCAPYRSFLLHAHWPVAENALRLHYGIRDFYTLTVESRRRRPFRRHRLWLVQDEAPERDPRSAESIRALEARLEAIDRQISDDLRPR